MVLVHVAGTVLDYVYHNVVVDVFHVQGVVDVELDAIMDVMEVAILVAILHVLQLVVLAVQEVVLVHVLQHVVLIVQEVVWADAEIRVWDIVLEDAQILVMVDARQVVKLDVQEHVLVVVDLVQMVVVKPHA